MTILKKLLSATIKIVISNNPHAFGIQRAKKHGLKVVIINQHDFKSKEAFDWELLKILQENQVDLVVLAGFMRIISSCIACGFSSKNHQYSSGTSSVFSRIARSKTGHRLWRKIYWMHSALCKRRGIQDPLLSKGIVPVYDDDTEDTLSRRILKEEHRIYPQAIQLLAEGKLQLEGRYE